MRLRRRSVDRAVEDLLRDRRPAAMPATEDEARVLRAAAELRAGRPGADLPRPEFVAALETTLHRAAAGSRTHPVEGRRGFLRGAGVATAAIVAGVAADRLAVRLGGSGTGDATPGSSPPPAGAEALVPDAGRWTPVATLADLRRTGALRFSTPRVEGVAVAGPGGSVSALSAVCTHMGCLLSVDAAAGRLDCPCHRAAFGLDGTPLGAEYLSPLPQLRSRVREGRVEVLLPEGSAPAAKAQPPPSGAGGREGS